MTFSFLSKNVLSILICESKVFLFTLIFRNFYLSESTVFAARLCKLGYVVDLLSIKAGSKVRISESSSLFLPCEEKEIKTNHLIAIDCCYSWNSLLRPNKSVESFLIKVTIFDKRKNYKN